MHSFNNAGAACPRHKILRALISITALSSPILATAAPVLTGTPAKTVEAAHYYAFEPISIDSSGKTLTFSVTNKPFWAHFDTSNGRLYGTPWSQSDVGTFANISISASDGTSRTTMAPFSITVTALPNIPPTVKGAPAGAVIVGHAYSFQPTATDPNGLRIEFGIWNKPSWATFDNTTGRLSGTPSAANVGTYSDIGIVAYDGYTKGVLPSFSIVVQAAAGSTPVTTPPPASSSQTGSATLSWVPPTENTSGGVLTNLAGYRIYYGTTQNLGQTVTLANPGLTRYVISGLTATTWYFKMTAYDTAGVESAPTAIESLIMQ